MKLDAKIIWVILMFFPPEKCMKFGVVKFHMTPCYLRYNGDSTTQFYRDYSKPTGIFPVRLLDASGLVVLRCQPICIATSSHCILARFFFEGGRVVHI